MTVQELLDWCTANNIDPKTPIALRDKDDYLLVPQNISRDVPYFGNCPNGDAYLEKVTPRNEAGDLDYDRIPTFLILGTGN